MGIYLWGVVCGDFCLNIIYSYLVWFVIKKIHSNTEFYKRNPNCKVILGVRDSDDQWFPSFRRYCDILAETDILAGAHTDLAKQDENYVLRLTTFERSIPIESINPRQPKPKPNGFGY